MNNKGHEIHHVAPNSIAEELGIEPGDKLLSINGNTVEDIFDYKYYINDEYVEVLIEKQDGVQWIYEIEKDLHEDLGLEFSNGLMDEYRSCTNKCMFCFIDQLPDNMRDTLYFKDDDSRLSFLQGNYVTLTNMRQEHIERIIQYHLEPINISVHTTNPELRCKMLSNRFAGKVLAYLESLAKAGIRMNAQVVLCKGVNDKGELEKTIADLSGFLPYMESLSVVPVGLTKYRDGLAPLVPFLKEDALEVIKLIERWQNKLYNEYASHFVHASDEWYIMAGKDFPEADKYDGYLQLENGVGMMRLLQEEFEEALEHAAPDNEGRDISIATGVSAFPYISNMVERMKVKFPGARVKVFPVINRFFGEKITVSGLVTGRDLMEQLKDKELGERLLLPVNMLKNGEEVFLDGVHVRELEDALDSKITIVDTKGSDLLDAVLLHNEQNIRKRNGNVYTVLYDIVKEEK